MRSVIVLVSFFLLSVASLAKAEVPPTIVKPLRDAVIKGNKQVFMEMLAKHKILVTSAIIGVQGETLLHLMSKQPHGLELIEASVTDEGDVEVQDEEGLTALHNAARVGNLELVDHLISQGVDVLTQDNHGKLASTYAAEEEHDDVVGRLQLIEAVQKELGEYEEYEDDVAQQKDKETVDTEPEPTQPPISEEGTLPDEPTAEPEPTPDVATVSQAEPVPLPAEVDVKPQGVPEFLHDLNARAEEGKIDPLIGRAHEVQEVLEILGRRLKNNPILVGEAGVGKTAIVEGLADLIVKDEAPVGLRDKIIYALDIPQLVAGTGIQGELEAKVNELLQFMKDNTDALLFIDEVHAIAGGEQGAIGNLLKPALARGELRCIGTTTNDEYQRYILKDRALARRFERVEIAEPTREIAADILLGVRDRFSEHHSGVVISDAAVWASVVYTAQYLSGNNLPDGAISLMDEAASAKVLEADSEPHDLRQLRRDLRDKEIYVQLVDPDDEQAKREIAEFTTNIDKQERAWAEVATELKNLLRLNREIAETEIALKQSEDENDTEKIQELKFQTLPQLHAERSELDRDKLTLIAQDVAKVVAKRTKVPIEKILQDEQEKITKLLPYLQEQIFGQDHVLVEIVYTLLVAFAGLEDETRPMGSFLLKGPTGSGKTETAKAIARFLFDTEDNMIRFDMSEFRGAHEVSKLYGSPPGYVGYEEGGILTSAVRDRPFSVILFDEIEKAHPEFANILLQILDDGRLTDNHGRVVDFRNTIIFLTTNSPNVRKTFRPELLNRLDHSDLTFKSLDREVMSKLVDKQLAALNARLRNKKIVVKLTPNAVDVLCEAGYDATYGARPLQRAFTKLINKPLADEVVAGKIESGKKYLIDINKEGTIINVDLEK